MKFLNSKRHECDSHFNMVLSNAVIFVSDLIGYDIPDHQLTVVERPVSEPYHPHFDDKNIIDVECVDVTSNNDDMNNDEKDNNIKSATDNYYEDLRNSLTPPFHCRCGRGKSYYGRPDMICSYCRTPVIYSD